MSAALIVGRLADRIERFRLQLEDLRQVASDVDSLEAIADVTDYIASAQAHVRKLQRRMKRPDALQAAWGQS